MIPGFKKGPRRAWSARAGLIAAALLLSLCLTAPPARAGSTAKAFCPCGYSTGLLFLFGGRANFRTYCAFPVYCEGCSKLEVVNLLQGPPTCTGCGGRRAIPYDDPSLIGMKGKNIVASWNVADRLGRVLQLTDGQYLCPKCRQYTLTFQRGGVLTD